MVHFAIRRFKVEFIDDSECFALEEIWQLKSKVLIDWTGPAEISIQLAHSEFVCSLILTTE